MSHFLVKRKDWDRIVNITGTEKFLINSQLGNDEGKVISSLYQEFLLMNPKNSVQIKERWEAEMQQEISREDWKVICSEALLVTGSNTWRELKWKVIARYFRTPQIMAKMGPTDTNKCRRYCGAQIGNHIQIFWSCSKLRPFWEEVYRALREVFHADIPQDPRIALLE